MADRLEVQFSSINQRGAKGCTVTVRLYRLGDPVTHADGTVTSPRLLLRSVTETIGPVWPWTRFVELYYDRAQQLATQFGWNLPDIVCSL